VVELATVDMLDQVGGFALGQGIQIAAVFGVQLGFYLAGQ